VVGPYVDFGHSGDTSEDDGAGGTYPPVNEDTETRKIEEVSTGIDYFFNGSNSECSFAIESTPMGNGRTTATESSTRVHAEPVQVCGRRCC
jgi:hypothetical protein